MITGKVRAPNRAVGAAGAAGRPRPDVRVPVRAPTSRAAREARVAREHLALLAREQAARAAAERSAERMARLQQVTAALSSALTEAQACQVVLREGVAALGARGGFVALVRQEGAGGPEAQLDVVPGACGAGAPAAMPGVETAAAAAPGVAVDVTTENWRRVHLGAMAPAVEAIRTGVPVLIESRTALAARFPDLGARAADEAHCGSNAWAAVPLLLESHAVGAMGLNFEAARGFDAEDRHFMMAIAGQCAQALERTRLIEAEHAARAESERLKDEFFANVSHDLRTPVTAIKASIGVVLANEPPDTPEPLHRLLVNVDSAADRMAVLVGDLLELTRLRAGRVVLEPEWHDLRALVLRVAQAVEPLAQQRQQRLVRRVPHRAIWAPVDADRLERALLNLLVNAQKYGPAGGSIQVSLAQRGDEAEFRVVDEGPGIPKDEQQRIFQRFYRAQPPAVPDAPQGSGLGLAIAQAMVRLHGGRIWVESEAGRGASFNIAIPLPPTPAPSAATGAAAAAPPVPAAAAGT